MLNITMYKAGNGDCISIKTDKEFVLIDGGTANSFQGWKHEIIDNVIKINSLIVTHIDNDHVNGIINLLSDVDCPEIQDVYYNGVEQLFGPVQPSCINIRSTEIILEAAAVECEELTNRQDIGYSEGTSLSYLLAVKNIKCNKVVKCKPIFREALESFVVGDIKFTIIGPIKSDIDDLIDRWENNLKLKKISPAILSKSYCSAFEQYLNEVSESLENRYSVSATLYETIESLANKKFESDGSLANKSSFSFLIEHQNKKILYLGDCHAETVLGWLDSIGKEKIKVDAVKVSHHGSKKNTSLDLLRRIECSKFLISTNGKSHGHPDLETLARIAFINKEKNTKIYFNYEIDIFPSSFLAELGRDYTNISLIMNYCEVEL